MREDETPRYVLRAAAARLPYSVLSWLAAHDDAPHMHRAEARREMRRRDRSAAAWLADFLARMSRSAFKS
jgi:hypothetical protein